MSFDKALETFAKLTASILIELLYLFIASEEFNCKLYYIVYLI
jgi:hypothetical protein